MPDKCHQKSFPTTCQAFWALWYNRSSLPLDNQNLAFVLHVPKMIQLRWFSWDDLSRNHRWVCFSSMGWGPWKAKVKIPRAPTYLSCFNICEARGTLQNGMSDQTHTHCEGLSEFMWPTTWPTTAFSRRGKMHMVLWECTAVDESRKDALGDSCLVEAIAKAFPSLSFLPHRESS